MKHTSYSTAKKVIVNLWSLTNKIMKKQIIATALRIMRENFSISELADLTGVDYRNMCAYCAGRKELPLKIAFFVLDYLGCRAVIFRNN